MLYMKHLGILTLHALLHINYCAWVLTFQETQDPFSCVFLYNCMLWQPYNNNHIDTHVIQGHNTASVSNNSKDLVTLSIPLGFAWLHIVFLLLWEWAPPMCTPLIVNSVIIASFFLFLEIHIINQLWGYAL